MIKPNWDVFRAKFSENPQNHFEWFCYMLFCQEFNQPNGIFRFKNQSAIENNPIKNDNEIIGWQAKFYDTSLSNHKNDLIKTLEKAKRDYSNITKILFYTNQEWAQNKGKKPQALIEVEKKSKELDIILDWRVASFFESEFVSTKNEVFAKHFFTLQDVESVTLSSRRNKISFWHNEIDKCNNDINTFFHSQTYLELNELLTKEEKEEICELSKDDAIHIILCARPTHIITPASRQFKFYKKVIFRLEREWNII